MEVCPPRIPRVGILGGGQLGRMLCLAAANLGVSTIVLDPDAACPAHSVCNELVVGHFRDRAAVLELASKVDVLTVEIEHIDTAALVEAQARFPTLQIHPEPGALALIQDKYKQKLSLREHGVPIGEFVEVHSEDEIREAARRFGLPLVLKAKRLAYDGRGNAVVRAMGDVEAAFATLRASGEVYAERWVPFVRELAVVVARGQSSEPVATYPVMHTVQRDGQCHVVHAPAPVSAAVQEAATRCALAAVGAVRGRGVFAVELFELPDGSVLFNEMAPRVHNSGHLTIEACHTSQFEQHVRCVAGLPLGSTGLRVPCAGMLNVVGKADEAVVWRLLGKALSTPACSLHWYGKACRPARKLGHVTVTGASALEVQGTLAQLLAAEAGEAAAAAAGGGTAAGSAPPAGAGASAGSLAAPAAAAPLVGIIMGSDSDLPSMSAAAQVLRDFGVPFELTVVSAHRTPARLVEYARGAHGRGLKVIIAGAGGAAHLPGMTASMTPLPVVGVPIPQAHLDGVDSLHSILQMPRGIPVATVAIGNAANAGLLAVRMLSTAVPRLQEAMLGYQARLEAEVTAKAERLEAMGWEAYAQEMAAAKRSGAAAASAASGAGR